MIFNHYSVIIQEHDCVEFHSRVNLLRVGHILVSYFVPMFKILTDHQIRLPIHNLNDAAP